MESNKSVVAILQGAQVCKVDADRASAQRDHVIAGRYDTDFPILHEVEVKRRRTETYVDLPGHGLGNRGGNVAGRGRLRGELVLRDKRQQRGMARRSRERECDRLTVEILDPLDWGIRGDVPIKIGSADHFAADDADRSTFGKGPHSG